MGEDSIAGKRLLELFKCCLSFVVEVEPLPDRVFFD
jgi:hypothetical protein